jgi:prolyl-tRNA editing enzyme YbaK/EbsC (Cys-tRNA(Pro) deacylase)
MGIAQYLADERVPFETLWYPPAYTAQRRAQHLGVSGRTVVKCVLLKGPAGYLVAVLPAAARVNTESLAKVLEGPVQLAETSDVSRIFGDCEWGVTLPFGSRYGLPTFLDASLDPDAVLVMPSHFHHEALRLRCRDFEQLERPRRLPLAGAPAAAASLAKK